MKKFRYWLRNVFGFSGREIRGFGLLTLLLVLAVAAPFLFKLISTPTPSDNTADIRKLDSLKAMLSKPEGKNSTPEATTAEKPKLSPFNPNELTVEQWKAIGLPASLAQRIHNYRQKGGTFRIKSDLLKIYGFPKDDYSRLESFIQLPDSLIYAKKGNAKEPSIYEKEATSSNSVKAERTSLSFDLNTADSAQLVQIKGVGPGLSRRIINYRSKLGGFYHMNQLREVYGLDSTVVDELLKYGYIKSPVIQQIAVNTATVQELDAHPYISPKVARILVDYRNQHGNYSSLESLYQIRALDRPTLDKLAPYLSFE